MHASFWSPIDIENTGKLISQNVTSQKLGNRLSKHSNYAATCGIHRETKRKTKTKTNLERNRLIEIHSNTTVVGIQRAPYAPQRRPERLHLLGHTQLFPHEVAVHQTVVVQGHGHQERVVYRAVQVGVCYN